MTNSTGGDAFSPAVLWNLIALAVPIVVAVVVATYKILKVLKAEIRSEISPVMSRFDDMERRFISAIRDLWDDNKSQDTRIETITAEHNRLRGAHDAIVKMGGHGEYGGPERRATPRGTRCSEPG
jgi:hypothetical protein